MLHEIQGILYDEVAYQKLRQIEEREAEKLSREFQEQMYREWVIEPTIEQLREVLARFPGTLKENHQTIDGICSAKPFTPGRYVEVIEVLVKSSKLELNQRCPICGTPKIKRIPVLGKHDSGMRCQINHFHLMASMAVEVMTYEQRQHVFGGTWLSHIIKREPIEMMKSEMMEDEKQIPIIANKPKW